VSASVAFGPLPRARGEEEPARPSRRIAPRPARREPGGEDGGGEILRRLLIRDRGRIVLLRLEEVDWIEGAGNYVRFHAAGEIHSLRRTLGALEARLDPALFVRVHRSTIVNLDRLAEMRARPSGGYELVLRDGSRLTLSRRHKHRFFALTGRP
jgi:two-component system LytT family response regulator